MEVSTESDMKGVLDSLRAYDFSQPRDSEGRSRDCDLVMKGGITSGVVYPLAVLELAKSHRFHSIGGTSAGAIAAVVTAAAEYARDDDGFKRLIKTVEKLQERGFVANVFQPAPELRPLLGLLFLVLKIKRRVKRQTDEIPSFWGIVGDTLKLLLGVTLAPKHLPAFVGGALGGIVGALIGGGWIAAAQTAATAGAATRSLIWGVLVIGLFWWLGTLIGTIGWLIFTGIPRNFYGICTGRPAQGHNAHRLVPAGDGPSEALTDWLSRTVNRIAGLPDERPLTFGDLKYRDARRATPTKKIDPKHKITLNTVTANLSQGQPYILPFVDRQFLFSEQEFEQLFPREVVRHMVGHAYKSPLFDTSIDIVDEHGASHTLHFLPDGDDMPVIVAARMSLSFPLLLSAVPLWTISRSALDSEEYRARSKDQPFALKSQHVRRNWFSDGGTCSNFPIHFYDQLFPPHPTFGINLDEEPHRLDEELHEPSVDAPLEPDPQWEQQAQYGPEDVQPIDPKVKRKPCEIDPTSIRFPSSYPEDSPGPLWKSVDRNLTSFIGSIINTGLFYRDILQSRLPSYYDRTVSVLLSDKEGGINLDMPPKTIQRIAYKGHLAGQAITECFDFDHHRWVRFRLLLSQLEQQMIELRKPMMDDAPPVDRRLIEEQIHTMRQFLQAQGITSNKVQQLIDIQLKADRDPARRFPLARNQEWVRDALPRLYALLLMIEVWGGDEKALFQLQSPELCAKDVNDDIDHILLRVTPEL